jgi:hypothetical protein
MTSRTVSLRSTSYPGAAGLAPLRSVQCLLDRICALSLGALTCRSPFPPLLEPNPPPSAVLGDEHAA